ncbi:MAG: hypothetical protein AB1491_08215 [Thermodesulfobacteriota bacterium]
MLGKKILAGVFAALILVKITFVFTQPGTWLTFTRALLDNYSVVTGIYLALLVLTGYFVFTSLDLIDVAVVMFFTAALMGLSLIPYLASMPQLPEEIINLGFAQAWPASIIWAALAVAVLYRVFISREKAEK